jgi:hypothetical protein
MPAKRPAKRPTTPTVTFTGMLVLTEEWTCLFLPPAAGRKLCVTGRAPVAGTINGFPIRSSIIPVGGGRFMLMVSRRVQEGARVDAGDEVTVTLAVDTAPRVVKVPADLQRALARSGKVAALFARMAYAHKREWVDWILDAKRPATRALRVARAVARLKAHLAKEDR